MRILLAEREYQGILVFLFVGGSALILGLALMNLPLKRFAFACVMLILLTLILKFPAMYLGIHISGLVPILLWWAGLRGTSGWSALLVMAVALEVIRSKEKWQGWSTFPMILQFAFAFHLVVSVWWLPEINSYSIEKIRHFFGWAFIPYLGVVACVLARELKQFIYSYFLCVIGFGLVGFLQVVLKLEPTDILEGARLSSLFYDPIGFGRIAGLALLFALWMLYYSKERYKVIIGLLLIIPLFTTLALTQTRGAVLATVGGVFIVLFSKHSKLISLLLVIGLIAVGFLVNQMISLESLANYQVIFSSDSLLDITTVSERIELFQDAWRLWLESPLLGKGVGGFLLYGGFLYPHNIFLEIGAELGIIGIGLFLVLIFYIVKYSFKNWREPRLDAEGVLCLASFVLMIIAAQFSYDIQRNGLVWVFGGIIIARSWMDQNSDFA